MNNHFDLIIIGAGAGGFAAAIKANELQARTALINHGLPLGGTCVNVGCIPSKTLVHAAEICQTVKEPPPWLKLSFRDLDFSQLIEEELSLVKALRRKKYSRVIEALPYVSLLEGKAKFLDRETVEVFTQQKTVEKISGNKFIIATGSTAKIPPIPGIKEAGYFTHVEILRSHKLPKSLAIIGAGPLGVEFSQIFSRFGSRVTLLQRGPTILPRTEKEPREALTKILRNEGITVRTNTVVRSISFRQGLKTINFETGGGKQEISVEEILLAAGKTPNTDALNLSAAGVERDEKKAIKVTKAYRTTNSRIFAVGDVAALPLRLETTAGREGTLAAENALKESELSLDYLTIPYTIFTDPQLAGVGLTEEAKPQKQGSCFCKTVSLAKIPKAVITRKTEGLIKLIADPQTRQILGVHLLSPNASEIITGAALLIKNRNTLDDLTASLPIFPSLSEALKIAALAFDKEITNLSCCV